MMVGGYEIIIEYYYILIKKGSITGVLEYQGIFLSGLNQPFGMALVGEHDFYVAVTDALLKCHYKGVGSNKIKRSSCKQVMALSASGYNNHWTRNIVHDEPNNRLLVTVGSASNIGEEGKAVVVVAVVCLFPLFFFSSLPPSPTTSFLRHGCGGESRMCSVLQFDRWNSWHGDCWFAKSRWVEPQSHYWRMVDSSQRT